MSIGNIKAGKATIAVSLEDDQFKKDWAQLQSSVSKITGILNKIALGTAAVGTGITLSFRKIIQSAINTEVAFRRFSLVFGDATALMTQNLRELASETGMSLTSLKQQAAGFGLIFSDLRAEGSDKFVMAVGAAQKAVVDLVGVAGIDMVDAQARIMSGLTSTGEALDQFGFKLRNPALQKAYESMGLGDASVKNFGEMEKMLLKIIIMQESIRTGQLDFANMASTVSGRIAQMNSQLTDLYNNLSTLILPIVKTVVWAFTQLLKVLNSFPLKYLTKAFGLWAVTIGINLLLISALLLSITGLTKVVFGLVAAYNTATTALAAYGGAGSVVIMIQTTLTGVTMALSDAFAALAVSIGSVWAMIIPLVIAFLAAIVVVYALLRALKGVGNMLESYFDGVTKIELEAADLKTAKAELKKARAIGGEYASDTRQSNVRKWEKRVAQLEGGDPLGAMGGAAPTQGVLGSRLLIQQMKYAVGVSAPNEQTAENTERMAALLERVEKNSGSLSVSTGS